jgi:hypothetical protein
MTAGRQGAGPTRTPTTLLRLSGRDALALLHRLGANALEDLAPGEARGVPFCDFRGRLLHRAVAARSADGAVWLLRDDAPGAELAAFLDGHLFREEVRIEDLSATADVRACHGAAESRGSAVLEERGGGPARVALPPSTLLEVGAALPPAEPDAEVRRIRAGVPRHGREVREEFSPFEVGLAREVHLSKGCFTGQEALLRLVTYGSVRRRLVLLEGAGPAPAAEDEVLLAGRRAGVVTSAAREGADWVGLAVLTHEACAPEARPALAGGTPLGRVTPFPPGKPQGLP